MSSLTKTELINNSAVSLALETQYSCHTTRAPRDTFKHTLYPIKQLPAFQTALQASRDGDKRIAQYIVTNKKQMLIAREGTPSASIPGHQDMDNAPVLAAGHIFFNAAGEVVGLSNESDDFKALEVDSMLWPVIILNLLKIPLATPFIIIPSTLDLDKTDSISTTGEFELTLTDRLTLTENLSSNLREDILKANQNDMIITREHLSEQRRQQQVRLYTVLTDNAPSQTHGRFFPSPPASKKRKHYDHEDGFAIEIATLS